MRNKLYCVKHEDEVLKLYCETCKELCCIHCLVSNHRKENHSCVAVSDVAKKQKEALESSCATLDEKISEGKEALNNICEVMKTLEKNAKTTNDQIEEQKENILKMMAEKLDEKAKQMKEEVGKIYDKLREELIEEHDEIKDHLHKVKASVALPKTLLKKGSIEEILATQKLIDENVEKLTNEQPEDLTPVNDGIIEHEPGDIGEINVNEIIGKLGWVKGDPPTLNNLKTSSSILDGKMAYIRRLHKWLGEKCKWNLCYKASRDGWSAQNFHKRCDNKGASVVLVKANDYIFGGYTDLNWSVMSGNCNKRSNSSFLFSLRNKDKLVPFIANIKEGQEGDAICCNSSCGPCFGGGNDLCICSNPQVNHFSYSRLGSTYQLPPGYVVGSEQANSLLAGQYKFKITEMEVFN